MFLHAVTNPLLELREELCENMVCQDWCGKAQVSRDMCPLIQVKEDLMAAVCILYTCVSNFEIQI